MIDQQAGLVLKLAKILGEVLRGKESAHSLRRQDLDQRREELRRRRQAAEQLSPVTVWQRVCDHLKQIIAGVGPPKSLRLLGIIKTESGNYGL